MMEPAIHHQSFYDNISDDAVSFILNQQERPSSITGRARYDAVHTSPG
jgi:hypothetical protein